MTVKSHNMLWIRNEEIGEKLNVKVRINKSGEKEEIHIIFNDDWFGKLSSWKGTFAREEENYTVFRLISQEHSGTGWAKKFKKRVDGIEGSWIWFKGSEKINERWHIQP